MVNPGVDYEAIAADLDRFAEVPDDVLLEIVTREGRCMWPIPVHEAPGWDGEELSDREWAARACAGCMVQRACLELDLRTAGLDTIGVWGGLSEADRLALYPVWLARRARMGGSS